MLIGLRNAMMSGGGGWQNPYVTDGLIAMWDGEWNAGPGKHDANATVWKNLVGDTAFDLSVKNSWNSDCLVMDGTFNCLCSNKTTLTELTLVATFAEVANTTSGFMTMGWSLSGNGKRPSFVYRNIAGNKTMRWYLMLSNEYNGTYSPSYNSVLMECDSNGSSLWANGAKVGENVATLAAGTANNRFRLGGYGSGSDADQSSTFFRGKVFHAAIYSRALTADEVAANYAIDKERFNLPDAT